MSRTLLTNGRVIDPVAGTDITADVLIEDGVIVAIGPSISTDADTIDVAGKVVTSGFIDLHTHLREPGFEDAEDVQTGSEAGAAGGYTALCAMAASLCHARRMAPSAVRAGISRSFRTRRASKAASRRSPRFCTGASASFGTG